MFGPRYGPRQEVIGARYGSSADEESGYFGITNPNLAIVGNFQSNAQGAFALAANCTDFPSIGSAYANVKIRRRGSAPAGLPPTWITEGGTDASPGGLISLQSRTVQVDPVSYPVGGLGVECALGRRLDGTYGPSGKWNYFGITMDGSGLENHWMQPVIQSAVLQYIRDFLTASNSRLELFVGIGGEADGGESPDFLDWYANLNAYVIGLLRANFNPNMKVILPLLSRSSGATSDQIVAQTTQFCGGTTMAAWVNTNDQGFRVDGVHYAEDAGGVKGFCTLGNRIADIYNDLNTGAYPPASGTRPFIRCMSAAVDGTSAQGVSVTAPPGRAVGDLLLFIYTGNGNTAIAAPTGYAELASSPQHNGASGTDARLQIFQRTATGNSADNVTTADVAGDGGKKGRIISLGNAVSIFQQAGTFAAAGTTVTWPTVDTTGKANCLLLWIDAVTLTTVGAKHTAWTAPGGITLHNDGRGGKEDDTFSTVSSAGMGIFSGLKATAGAVAAYTATIPSATMAMITLAISPT